MLNAQHHHRPTPSPVSPVSSISWFSSASANGKYKREKVNVTKYHYYYDFCCIVIVSVISFIFSLLIFSHFPPQQMPTSNKQMKKNDSNAFWAPIFFYLEITSKIYTHLISLNAEPLRWRADFFDMSERCGWLCFQMWPGTGGRWRWVGERYYGKCWYHWANEEEQHNITLTFNGEATVGKYCGNWLNLSFEFWSVFGAVGQQRNLIKITWAAAGAARANVLGPVKWNRLCLLSRIETIYEAWTIMTSQSFYMYT